MKIQVEQIQEKEEGYKASSLEELNLINELNSILKTNGGRETPRVLEIKEKLESFKNMSEREKELIENLKG